MKTLESYLNIYSLYNLVLHVTPEIFNHIFLVLYGRKYNTNIYKSIYIIYLQFRFFQAPFFYVRSVRKRINPQVRLDLIDNIDNIWKILSIVMVSYWGLRGKHIELNGICNTRKNIEGFQYIMKTLESYLNILIYDGDLLHIFLVLYSKQKV